MAVDTSLRTATDTGKVVEIELTTETLVFRLIKPHGHDRFGKGLGVVDFEAPGNPTHNVFDAIAFGIFQHFVEFEREDAFGKLFFGFLVVLRRGGFRGIRWSRRSFSLNGRVSLIFPVVRNATVGQHVKEIFHVGLVLLVSRRL